MDSVGFLKLWIEKHMSVLAGALKNLFLFFFFFYLVDHSANKGNRLAFVFEGVLVYFCGEFIRIVCRQQYTTIEKE